MTDLSTDAIVFGYGHLGSPQTTLSFGGDCADMEITERARAALNELLQAGYAEPSDPTDSIPNREFYRGKGRLIDVVRARKINPFSAENRWPTFILSRLEHRRAAERSARAVSCYD